MPSNVSCQFSLCRQAKVLHRSKEGGCNRIKTVLPWEHAKRRGGANVEDAIGEEREQAIKQAIGQTGADTHEQEQLWLRNQCFTRH